MQGVIFVAREGHRVSGFCQPCPAQASPPDVAAAPPFPKAPWLLFQRGTALSVSHLLVISIISGCAGLARASDLAAPKDQPDTAPVQSIFLIVPLVLVSAALFFVGRYLLSYTARRTTTPIGPPPPAVHNVLVYPPPLYLQQRRSTPVPVLHMWNSLTAVPQETRMQATLLPARGGRRWSRPGSLIAVLSLILTFIGLVIAGLSLQYTQQRSET